jgi:hypothetical protein
MVSAVFAVHLLHNKFAPDIAYRTFPIYGRGRK